MDIRNHKLQKTVANLHGIKSYKLLDADEAQIMQLVLNPHEELKPHITPVDVCFYILEGSPEILIGEERQFVQKDDLIISPRDIIHCIYNPTESVVRLLVIKTPRPQKPTRFVSLPKEENMKFSVDPDLCVGCGACASICPTVFKMVSGKAQVIIELVPRQSVAPALEAKEICPVQAINHE